MPPEKLSIVVFSGDFDRVHYALVMASAAVATGTGVTLFLTMGACRAVLAPDADGVPSWRRLPTTDGIMDGGAMDDDFAAKGVAGFEDLLAACGALGVRFMVCEMGLRALGLERDALRGDIEFEEGGVVTFLADASKNGAMLFV